MSKTAAADTSTSRTAEIPPTDWKFGSTAKEKTRIIVTFKDKDGTWVNLYKPSSKKDGEYYCVKCSTKNYGKLINDIFHAPKIHVCTKICAKKFAIEQKEREEKFLKAQGAPSSSAAASSTTKSLPSTPKAATAVKKPNPFLISKKASSPISELQNLVNVVDQPRATKPDIVETLIESDDDERSSPLQVLFSTPRVAKPTINSFFKQSPSRIKVSQESTHQSTPAELQPKQSTTPETRMQEEKALVKSDEKENKLNLNVDKKDMAKSKKNDEPKNTKIKKTTLGDDIEIIEEDEVEATVEPPNPIDHSEVPQPSKSEGPKSDEKENKLNFNVAKKDIAKPKKDDVPKNKKIKKTTMGDIEIIEGDEDEATVETPKSVNEVPASSKSKGSKTDDKSHQAASTCTQPAILVAKNQTKSCVDKTNKAKLQQPNVLPSSTTATDNNPSTSFPEVTPSQPSPLSSVSASSAPTGDREVDNCFFEYGFSEEGKLKGLLIVREPEPNRSSVRVYCVTDKKEWKCLNCKIGTAKKTENNTFMVSAKHDCLFKSYSNIQKNQKIYEAKFLVSQMKRTLEASSSPTSSKLRRISSKEWEWGCDSSGNKNMRIIVFFDPSDKTQVHEYRNAGKKILCLGCHNDGKNVYASRSNDKNPIISIPSVKEHICKPRNIEDVREQQKTFSKKPRKRSRIDDGDSDIGDELEDERNEGAKRIRRSARLSAACRSPENEMVHREKNGETEDEEIVVNKSGRRSAKRILIDSSDDDQDMDSPSSSPIAGTAEDEPMIEASSPAATVPQKPPSCPSPGFSSNHSTTVRFFNPSTYELEKFCDKLGIQYFREAYTFWNKIYIKNVTPTSIPNSSHSVTNDSGFAALSLFLTGTEANATTIHHQFNTKYFIKNLAEIGNNYGEDFSQMNEKTADILCSNTLTKYHLQAFCSLLECRIGIFTKMKWERYGNWDDEVANVLTFLMQKEGEKLSPILSLI